MLFQRPFHPSKKNISWGKHWTEMFMDVSLIVSQNNVREGDYYRLKETMKFHCNIVRSFLICMFLDILSICAVVVPSHMPSDCDA